MRSSPSDKHWNALSHTSFSHLAQENALLLTQASHQRRGALCVVDAFTFGLFAAALLRARASYHGSCRGVSHATSGFLGWVQSEIGQKQLNAAVSSRSLITTLVIFFMFIPNLCVPRSP